MPTLEEAGVKGFDVTTWYALMAPHGTAAATVQRVSSELEKILKQAGVRKRFDEQGLSAGDMTPVQLAGFIQKETAKWTGVSKQAGLAPQ